MLFKIQLHNRTINKITINGNAPIGLTPATTQLTMRESQIALKKSSSSSESEMTSPLRTNSVIASPINSSTHVTSNIPSSSSLFKTILNLTGCVLGVAGSVCYEVTAYWTKVKKIIHLISDSLLSLFRLLL